MTNSHPDFEPTNKRNSDGSLVTHTTRLKCTFILNLEIPFLNIISYYMHSKHRYVQLFVEKMLESCSLFTKLLYKAGLYIPINMYLLLSYTTHLDDI